VDEWVSELAGIDIPQADGGFGGGDPGAARANVSLKQSGNESWQLLGDCLTLIGAAFRLP